MLCPCVCVVQHRHKSTALQTLLLVRPRSGVSVHTYPGLPVYDPSTTAVLFPSEGALTVRQLAAAIATLAARNEPTSASSTPSGSLISDPAPSSSPSPPPSCPVRSLQRIVFLEGTWDEAQLMLAHPKLQALTQLRLDFGSEGSHSRGDTSPAEAASGSSSASPLSSSPSSASPSTAFWRYQRFGSSFLSSIEAIYHTVAQMQAEGLLLDAASGHAATSPAPSSSPLTPSSSPPSHLLWLFAMSHERVRAHYRQNPKLLPPPLQS